MNLVNRDFEGSDKEAWIGGTWFNAAPGFCISVSLKRDRGKRIIRRIKGVVNPQAMPTSRKPIVQRKIEGEGSSPAGTSISSSEVSMTEMLRAMLSLFENTETQRR